MRASKLRVGVLFGGRSCEHEVSVRSARAVLTALDRDRYDAVPIGVSRTGRWHLVDETALAGISAVAGDAGPEVVMPPRPRGPHLVAAPGPMGLDSSARSPAEVDVVFPLIHGPLGEDGTVQGLLELAGVPYVGSGVLGSAVGMDKGVMKSVLHDGGLPVCPYRVVLRNDWRDTPSAVRRACESTLGYPVFVKPANLGSSIGISRVDAACELATALDEAARYNRRIIVESAIEGAREIEVAVIGNHDPMASVPGEVVPAGDFYDYHAKYASARTRLVVPAEVPASVTDSIRDVALQAFRLLDCAGLARVDFLLRRDDGALFVNEVNTLPGFTDASMFPRLWEASGLDRRALVDRLIALALERHVERQENRSRMPSPRSAPPESHPRSLPEIESA